MKRLVHTERLSEKFQESLLCRVHPGFAMHGERVVWRDDLSSLERLARHALTRSACDRMTWVAGFEDGVACLARWRAFLANRAVETRGVEPITLVQNWLASFKK